MRVRARHLRLVDMALRPVDAALEMIVRWRAQQVELKAPIFLVGAERSGTTLLYGILANHPDLYWLSRLDNALPSAPVLTTVTRRFVGSWTGSRSVYGAVPRTIARSRGRLPPSEGVEYWRRVFRWGDERCYGIEDDRFDARFAASPRARHMLSDLQMRLLLSGKKRLLIKQLGMAMRVPFLHAVFPDAVFVHVLRHPASNFRSLVQAKRQSGERFWGIKIPGWRDLLEAPIEFQVVAQLEAVSATIQRETALAASSGVVREVRVRYEDFLRKPEHALRELASVIGIDVTKGMLRALGLIEPRSVQRETAWDGVPREYRHRLARLAAELGYVAPIC